MDVISITDRFGCAITCRWELAGEDSNEYASSVVAELSMDFSMYNFASDIESRAVQLLLQLVATNPDAQPSDQLTAVLLSIWIGSADVDVLSLCSTSHWAAAMIKKFLDQYPLTWEMCRSVDLLEAHSTVQNYYQNVTAFKAQVVWSVDGGSDEEEL